MNLPVMALILVFLLLIWLLLRRRQATPREETKPVTRVSETGGAYHAVSIKFSGKACEPAKALDGRRFLSSAAPKLPLPQCDVLECNCKFVHHKDRRTGKDRRSPFGPSGFGTGTGSYEAEQREGKDRRANKDEDLY